MGELLSAARNVLYRLNDGKLVRTAFGLHRNNELLAFTIYPDIEFVNLNLSHIFNGSPKVILQGVGRDSEKGVEKPIIPYSCENGLFLRLRIVRDNFWRRVRNLNHRAFKRGKTLLLPRINLNL